MMHKKDFYNVLVSFLGRLFLVSSFWVLLVAAMGIQPLVAAAEDEQAQVVELPIVNVSASEAEVLVDYFSADEVVRNAAKAFVKEVYRRTGILLPIRHRNEKPSNISIHIGNTDSSATLNAALESLGKRPVSTDKPGTEGFQLVSGRVGDQGIVVINGCDSLGTFHGVGRLLRKMRFSDRRAFVPLGLNISTTPVTWQRRIIFELNCCYAVTDIDGFRDMWTDLIFWGLSAVSQSCDPAQQGDPRVSDFSRYNWDQWSALVPLTQSLGLDMVHVTQVNLVAKEGEFGPSNIPNFDELNYKASNANGVNPKFPRAREVLYASRKWFFEHMPYADKVDHVISGWDTGGVTKDPELGPWSIAFAELVDSMTAPLIFKQNPDAKVLFRGYGLADFKDLAEKMHNGWQPKSIYGIEFSSPPQMDWAHLVPEQYKRIYLPVECVDDTTGYYGAMGVNPHFKRCASRFDHAWNDCGIRDGTGAYSEGVTDHFNQIIFLQKAWDQKLMLDEILDDMCRYYFGEQAAPILKEAFLRMEQAEPGDLADPKVDPRVQELVAQAEPLLPSWARSSRQWAMVVARADIERTRRRQADLLANFDQRWQEYASLSKPEAADGLISYFQSVAENAWELERIYKRMEHDVFGVMGGNQTAPVWPDPRTAEAIEALEALRQLKQKAGSVVPTRWCVAFVDQHALVCVSDGWGNCFTLGKLTPKYKWEEGVGPWEGSFLEQKVTEGPQAADAQLVVADLGGGHNEVVFLATDGLLYRWNPMETTAKVLAKGQFLTGPLAKGDLNGDGKDELVVLRGASADDSFLAIVDAQGKTVVLKARPSGPHPDVATDGIVWFPADPSQTARTDMVPKVRVCDVDADGKLEIAYADRDQKGKLVIMDAKGEQKWLGPAAPAGVLADGDMDGDGMNDLVYLDSSGYLAAFSPKAVVWVPAPLPVAVGDQGVLNFGEKIKPKWNSSVVVAHIGQDTLPKVVYTDQNGILCEISIGQKGRRLTDVTDKTVLVGPGLVAGDFNGDGREDVCCLRSRRFWDWPLATLSYVDESGGYRDLSVSTREMRRYSYAAPLGPRASGQMSVPIIHQSYAMERVFHLEGN